MLCTKAVKQLAQGGACVRLSDDQAARFYVLLSGLLSFVNRKRRVLPSAAIGDGEPPQAQSDIGRLLDILWTDDTLLDEYLGANPDSLTPTDLAIVASWRMRITGIFFVERYLNRYTVFLLDGPPIRAYGVLGLSDPLQAVIGGSLPVLVDAVLLPFEGQIVYDSVLRYVDVGFQPGVSGVLERAYRLAQVSDALITAIEQPSDPDEAHDVQMGEFDRRMSRLARDFERAMEESGLASATIERHSMEVSTLLDWLLTGSATPINIGRLAAGDLQRYLTVDNPYAQAISLRRFFRFLAKTKRVPSGRARDLLAALPAAKRR